MNTLIGNAVVGQSGGPTAAINASLAGVIAGVKKQINGGAIRKLYGMRNGIEGFLEERLVDLTDRFADEETLDLLYKTPAAALGSCRKKLPSLGKDDAVYEQLVALFQKYDIRYFFYIGGNDSMDTVDKLSAYTAACGYEMRIIGVPKTIDNDLVETDHTPGFGSAAKFVATTTQEILRDCAVYTTNAVTILEIMGRDAGWLTAASALGRAVGDASPDLVYLPERDFCKEQFLTDVRTALARHPNVVIAVSEGIHYADGRYVGEDAQDSGADAFGHKQLAGSGKWLELLVKREIGCKVRSVELNLPQRCAAHLASFTDLNESRRVGEQAAQMAVGGTSGVMITIERTSNAPYTTTIGCVPVQRVANQIKRVPLSFINEEGNHVTDACLEYLLPLIRGEVHPTYRDGLPLHFVL